MKVLFSMSTPPSYLGWNSQWLRFKTSTCGAAARKVVFLMWRLWAVVSAGSVWVVQGESCQHGLVAQTSLSLSVLNSEMNNEAELRLSYIKNKPCSIAFVLCSNQWENYSEHIFMLQNTIQFLKDPLNVVRVSNSGWIITEIH